jgi:hypothetical protein
VDHVIQALKTMNFDSHIKKLTSELNLSGYQNEEKKEIIEDAQEMKDLINQQKKKNKKRKRHIEFTEEMMNQQMSLFNQAKIDNLMLSQSLSQSQLQPNNHIFDANNGLKVNGNKKMRIDEKDIFMQQKKNDEVDFD